MSLLDAVEPPGPPDFRRSGPHNVPMVLDPVTGSFVRYRRPSSAGKILDDESALTDWRIRSVVVGAAQRPDLMAQVSTLNPDTDKRGIRDVAEQCLVTAKGTQRQVTGSAVHRMTDLIDLGEDWEAAPQFRPAIDAYLGMLDAYGLVPVDVEVHCVNDACRMAGTMDRRYRVTRNLLAPDSTIVPIGSIIAGDTKTGRVLEYASGSYATQIAAYVDSLGYDVVTNERYEFDPPTFRDWAVIVHLTVDDARCELYWVNVEAGRTALALAEDVREWRKRTDLVIPCPQPLRIVPTESRPVATTGAALGSQPGSPEAAPRTAVDEPNAPERLTVAEWLRGRIRAIVAAGDAPTKQLQRLWPVGVPGLKHGGHSQAQLDAIAKALDDVETWHSLTFAEPDPRTQRDYSDRWARPRFGDTSTPTPEVVDALAVHPRRGLLAQWVSTAEQVDDTTNVFALTHALYEWGKLGDADWPDDLLTTMLDGAIRALGYEDGIKDLRRMALDDVPKLMGAAFAVADGEAVLMYDNEERPVVRVISQPTTQP